MANENKIPDYLNVDREELKRKMEEWNKTFGSGAGKKDELKRNKESLSAKLTELIGDAEETCMQPEMYRWIKIYQQKIKTFPRPSERDSLADVISTLMVRQLRDCYEIEDAVYCLMRECIDKAELMYPDDTELCNLLGKARNKLMQAKEHINYLKEKVAEKERAAEKAKKAKERRTVIIGVTLFAIVLIIVLLFG